MIRNSLVIKLLSFSVIALLIVITYGNLINAFFQQDEWLAFGLFLSGKSQGFLRIFLDSISLSGSVHTTPLSVGFFYLEFLLFGLKFSTYALTSLFLHLINAILVFYFIKNIVNKYWLAFASATLFAVSSINFQAISWMAANINTEGSALFLLLSLIFLVNYIKTGENRTRYLYTSSFLLLIGLMFKEAITFAFILIPIFWFILSKRREFTFLKKLLIPFFITGFIYSVFMFFNLFVFTSPSPASIDKPWISVNPDTYIFRLISLPIKIIPQSIIPAGLLVNISKKIVYLAYPQYFAYSWEETNPYVVETVLFDMVNYFAALIIIALSYIVFRKLQRLKNNELASAIIIAVFLISSSALPFMLLPSKSGFFSIFEQRHLYIGTIGGSLLLTIFLYTLVVKFNKYKIFFNAFIIVSLLTLIFFHYLNIQGEIMKLNNISQDRKNILAAILKNYPFLQKKIVFYTESDSSYYGLPRGDNIIPFQSGVGQTLLVWYKIHGEELPDCLLKDAFLYEMESEGYKECDGRGFGYFRKFESLKKALEENNLSAEDVISFSWNSKEKKFTETTAEIRKKLISHL